MAPVVDAVGAYHAAPTGDTMLQLITAIRDIPPAKKMKYQQSLNALYATFPRTIYVTSEPSFALSIVPSPGVGVPLSHNVPSHQLDAVLALQELHNTNAGRALLRDIVTNTTANNPNTTQGNPRRVAVKDAVGTASGGNECQIVHGMPDDYRTPLCVALSTDHNRAGTEIGRAMTSLTHAPAAQGSFDWLQDAINAMPIYELEGLPNTERSSTQRGNNWISAAVLEDWVTNNNFPQGLDAARLGDAQVALGAVLADGAGQGIGGHSQVRWSASNTMVLGQQRPSFIGLGHELIHAYHNQLGDQLGSDNGTADTALFEYQCVGLGHFAGTEHTENGLRDSAGLPPRDRYG
jgi:hypothetical protein